MSAYIETLIPSADDLTIDPQVRRYLLGVMSNKAGQEPGTDELDLLMRQAEHSPAMGPSDQRPHWCYGLRGTT